MADVSKKHSIDGLTVYSKVSKEEIEEEPTEVEESPVRQKEVPRKGKRKAWIIVGIIVTVLVLGGLGVWFAFRKPTFLGSKFAFNISASQEAASGADFSYTIEYSNKENVPLENVEIEAFYPDGFIFLSSNPLSWEGTSNIWKFDQIEAGVQEKITIQGKLLGEIGSRERCKVKLTYKPQNVSSTFAHDAEATTKITSTALVLGSELSEATASDTEVVWTVRYSNVERNDLNNIKIETIYPDGFEFESAKPEPTGENNTWENLTLKANQEAEIKIKGKVFGNLDETKVFKAQIGIIDNQGKFWLQQKIENSTRIIEVNLEVNHTLDKEITGLGDLLEYKTTLKNRGSVAIKNVVVTGEIDPDLLDDTGIIVEGGEYKENQIIWNKDSLDSLASIEPEEEVQVSFKVKVIQNIKIQEAEDKNFIIKNKVKVKGEVGEKSTIWESNEVSCKVATTLILRSEGHYLDYEGVQVGSGPIPPEVGKTTSYMIYWNVNNKTNDVKKAKVTAILPKDVKWTGKTTVSDGTISFDSKTNKVTWEIGDISANVGSILPGLEATFEVSITPKKSDVGKILPLLGEATVLGTDSFCSIEVLDSTNAITTDLEYDVKAKGKGKVVEAKP